MTNITALKCALELINKKVVEKPTGGMKFTSDDTIIKGKYADIAKELTDLIKALESGTVKEVKTCSTCAAFQAPLGAKQGWCFPKEFTNTRSCDGHCDRHERRAAKNEKQD